MNLVSSAYNDREEAHHKRKSSGPFRAVDNALRSPHFTVRIRLRRIDAANRHPNNEDKDNNEVEKCAKFVQLANELGRVHSEKPLNDQQCQK